MAKKKDRKNLALIDWDAVAEAERFGALAISRNHKKKKKVRKSLALIDWAGIEEVSIAKGARKALKNLRKRKKSRK